MALVYPDAIGAPPTKKKAKKQASTHANTPGPWRDGYVLAGGKKSKAGKVIVSSSSKALAKPGAPSSTALATTGGAKRPVWIWIAAGLSALALAFWYTSKQGKGRRSRPLVSA